MKVTRKQSGRPSGHVGPFRFSFQIEVKGDSGPGQARRAVQLARTDAENWCSEMRASGLVSQFEKSDDNWTEDGKLIYVAYFGTDLWLDD